MMNSKVTSVNDSSSKSKAAAVKSSSKSPGRKMNNQSKSAVSAEGVYSNGRLMHTMTSLVGNVAQVVLKDGKVYEGVLKTFSPKVSAKRCVFYSIKLTNSEQLDVVLESVTEVDNNGTSEQGCTISSLIKSLNAKKPMSDTMIFEIENIVSLDLLDVDLDYAFKDGFKTDTEISGLKSSSVEKELVAWTDDTLTTKKGSRALDDLSLDSTNGQTGWSAQDMFAYNEKVNGVTVGYKGLENVYTTAIDRSDPNYRSKAELAEKIAREITLGGGKGRPNEDDDEVRDDRDEEQRWSEVIRDDSKSRYQQKSDVSFPKPSRSEGMWRDTKFKPSSQPRQQQPMKQQGQSDPQQHRQPVVSNRTHPAVHSSPKLVADPSHHQHPELGRRTSNPQIPRTPPKEQSGSNESARPISFAAAVGQSEAKNTVSSNQNQARIQSQVVPEEHKVETKAETQVVSSDVTSQGKIVGQGESPKSDQLKKSDSVSGEGDKDSVSNPFKSKLNPNAKEFTFNPAAKPFTPKSHFSPPPQQAPLIGSHPNVAPQMAQIPYQQQQQQQIQPHHQQQPKQQQASQYLVMNPPGSNMVMPGHQQVIGPNPQPFQLLNPVVVNQLPGNPHHHNSNQYNPGGGYNPGAGGGASGQTGPRKPHHGGPREPRGGNQGGHSRVDNGNSYNQHNPHNVAAATGHPVLAGAPLTATGPMQYNHHQGGPAGPGQPMFPHMFVPGYPPRMFQPQMITPYDPTQYFMPLSMVQSAVQPQQQQSVSNGPHSTPSTPQSQTPSTPGLHGGPSTPGPGGHAVIPQTPSPQQSGVMYPGQPIHGPPGTTFNPGMVLMQAPPPSHPGLGPPPNHHQLQSGQVMMTPPSATSLTQPGGAQNLPPHFNQNQPPPPTQRPI